MAKLKSESFSKWYGRVDALSPNQRGINGVFDATLIAPHPDKEERSSYVDFFYQLGRSTKVQGVVYSDEEISSRTLQGLALDYLQENLQRHEVLQNPNLPSQFTLFPKRTTVSYQEVETDSRDSAKIRDNCLELHINEFLRQTGTDSVDIWGGPEGVEHYINPQ